MSVRLEITPEVQNTLDRFAVMLGKAWARYGSPELHERARLKLAEVAEVLPVIDAGLSERIASRCQIGKPLCYWNSAGATITEPELRDATFCEGVIVYHTGPSARVRGVEVEWGGFLEVDGRVVDVTAPVLYESQHMADADRMLRTAIYMPIRRYTATEAADRWSELPLLLSDPMSMVDHIDTTLQVFGTYTELQRAAVQRKGSRRWKPPRG